MTFYVGRHVDDDDDDDDGLDEDADGQPVLILRPKL